MSSISGVLPVDKPAGPTSHDIVQIVRRSLGLRRAGHTGTLDPFATGLLLVCVGPATRLAEYLTSLPKTYHATMRLGVTTETDDLEGIVLRSDAAWGEVTRDQVDRVLASQQGEILQLPPKYSAKRIGGKRAHAIARAGGEVDRKAVPVQIHRIEMTRFDPPALDLEVECSSGTYIRSIARDVGESLGVGAHLVALRRSRIGDFSVDDALKPEQLASPDLVVEHLVAPLDAVGHLGRFFATPSDRDALRNGVSVALTEGAPDASHFVAASEVGELLAIGEVRDGVFRPRKVFTDA